jgi:hypothetical protein
VPGGRFDIIKLDVEGEERALLADAASRPALCAALCLVFELHEGLAPGAEAAADAFLDNGCPVGSGFVPLPRTGEYVVLCQRQLMAGGV